MKQHLLFFAWLTAGLLACADDDHESNSTSRASAATTTTGTGGTATVGAGGSAIGGSGGSDTAISVTLTVDPLSMSAGATVNGTIAVENFVLEAAVGQPNQPGHGHYHIYLDQASGIDYLVSDEVPSVPISIPEGTALGMHTLRISLGENNHLPLNPPVEDFVDITVQ
jgi:hypothetical protein